MHADSPFPQIVEDCKRYLRKDLKHHGCFSEFVRSCPFLCKSLTQWMKPARHIGEETPL